MAVARQAEGRHLHLRCGLHRQQRRLRRQQHLQFHRHHRQPDLRRRQGRGVRRVGDGLRIKEFLSFRGHLGAAPGRAPWSSVTSKKEQNSKIVVFRCLDDHSENVPRTLRTRACYQIKAPRSYCLSCRAESRHLLMTNS